MSPTDRRTKFRQGLSTLYLPFYDALCGLLTDEWQPYSGFRTFNEQDQLYAKGRTRPGGIITNAKGGESAHNYGCATDWCPWTGGVPLWPGASDPTWKPYLDAIEKVGLVSGSSFGDFPHNELTLNASWRHILLTFKQNGMKAAQEHIERSVAK